VSQLSKSNLSKFLFKHLSERNSDENLYSEKHLKKAIDEISNNFELNLENIFEFKLNQNSPIAKVIDINSTYINENLNADAVKSKYYDINDSKIYENYLNYNNEKKEKLGNINYENINEISFNNNNTEKCKNTFNLNNNNNKASNNNTFNTPPTPTLNNLSLSNHNPNNNNFNQIAIFEEYENLLNNLNEKVIYIQKDLNSLLINMHKYTEKDLLQIDSNQKFSLKNSSNNFYNSNNETFINLNLENKNSENIFDDSLFLTHKDCKKRNFDDTNILQKNNISCNHILANNPNTNFIYTVDNIFTNIFKIKAYLKLVNASSSDKNNLDANKEGNFIYLNFFLN
jgi:hypothetical protein